VDRELTDLLICPACRGNLRWAISALAGDHVLDALATCEGCGATYPVQDGIGMFRTPDQREADLWETAETGLIRYLRGQPDLEHALLETPANDLNPADQFFRAMVLEARGAFSEAKAVEVLATSRAYTGDYTACSRAQLDFVQTTLNADQSTAPILDLACGRGYLVERLLAVPNRLIIATDYSPRVLRRNRRYWATLPHAERVSLIACDARQMPFKSGAIRAMTTNLGLSNITAPERLLPELRRISGDGVQFLAIVHFFPATDDANAAALRELGLQGLAYYETALALYASAGWMAELANRCVGAAKPTPSSVILGGARLDALPVAETVLEWGVLIGR
jgi:uncharacterized protein YbaR (Trm112 family)